MLKIKDIWQITKDTVEIKFGDEITPAEYAVTVKVIQIESDEKSVQQNNR